MKVDWQNQWLALGRRLAARGDIRVAGESLLARYDESHRAYHNREHLHECLAELQDSRGAAVQPDVVELAIWFHDAVYDSRRSDNEEQSAKLLLEFCQQFGIADEAAQRAADLVIVTKTHRPGEDLDATLLVDIDLSILGQSRDRFARYEHAIREEYLWAPAEVYRQGRMAVLEGFLARERIYGSARFGERYERSARVNLAWAIGELSEEA